jgi:primosomal protein N' (replication factor Y)
MTADLFAEIALPVPLNQTFSYIVPEEMKAGLRPGMRALVPFGRRMLTGYVLSLGSRAPEGNLTLREIRMVPDAAPLIDICQLRFISRLSSWFHAPIGEMLQASLPPSYSASSRSRISLTGAGRKALGEKKSNPEAGKILEALGDKSYSDGYLRAKVKLIGFADILRSLEKQGLIEVERLIKTPSVTGLSSPAGSLQLEMDFSSDPELIARARDMADHFKKEGTASFYLYGGRSQREAVYRELIRCLLALGRTVLFLTPGIALLGNLASQIEAKLGRRALVLHSRQTDRQREEAWQSIGSGAVDVVFGPRSALFSPLPRLGLVIVDDEHDESYFQQESPVYDARQGAVFKAQAAKALLVKGSSRPTVEAYYRARKEKRLIRCGGESTPPAVEIRDDRRDGPAVHPGIREEMGRRISGSRPVIIFLNRRGYAAYLICPRCGYIPRCERCEIVFSYHRREGNLLCHYCSRKEPVPGRCPDCGGRLRVRGMGIEGLAESLKKLFPRKTIQSFDSDSLPRRRDQDRVLTEFRQGNIDVLLGTQLLARRTDVPPVSLVVVFQPESLLALADFQAGQKCFSYLSRAGDFLDRDKDKDKDSKVFIQTTLGDHYSIRAAASGDYSLFYEEEIKYRRLMDYPPFAELAEVLLAGENLRTVAGESRRAAAGLMGKDVVVLGPAIVPTAKISGRYRVQIICKSRSRERLQEALDRGLQGIRSRKKIITYG